MTKTDPIWSTAVMLEICVEAHRDWPTDGMLDPSCAVLLRLDLPELLNPDAVDLVLVVLVQIELGHEAFGELATTPLSENRAFGMEFHLSLIHI